MNDTTRRFLTAIVDRVPTGGRIIELRLFPAIRQGGMESGVAVVAVELAPPAAELEDAPLGEAPESLAEGDDASVDRSPVDASISGEEATAAEQHAAEQHAAEQHAVVAHELVDTDIVAEEEEGTLGRDTPASTVVAPHADAADDDAVGEALDEELHAIVVNAAREVVAAEARAIAAAAGTHPDVDVDEVPGDAEVPTIAEPGVGALPDAPRAPGPPADAYAPEAADDVRADDVRADDVLADDVLADDESPYADAPIIAHVPTQEILADAAPASLPSDDPDSMVLSDILALPSPTGTDDDAGAAAGDGTGDAALEDAPIERLAILTARYRLVLKGPDRGQWEVDITHEADAPLATVERVARGVAKRSGDDSEPEHFSAASLREALDAPAWITTA